MKASVFGAALRALGSRRLAVWLLVTICVYGGLATLIPQGGPSVPAVARWTRAYPFAEGLVGALGLHGAFGNPVFVAIMALLALSTTVCAAGRTTRAVSLWRGWGAVSPAAISRVRDHPQATMPVRSSAHAVAGGEPGADALDRVVAGLGRLGLSARRESDLVVGTKGRLGLLGSPLFHWSLALLIVVIGLGRLTRSEGLIRVAEGSSVIDQAAAYSWVEQGPLFGSHTRLRIAVKDVNLDYRSGGLDRGPAPLISLLSGDRSLATQRVYSNNPLRFGRLTVHMAGYGPAATIIAKGSDGAEIGRTDVFMQPSSASPSGVLPARFSLVTRGGAASVDVTVSVLVPRGVRRSTPTPLRERQVVLTSASPLLRGARVVLQNGETVTLTDGTGIEFAAPRYYADLTVVEDWSVIPIYVLFWAAAIGGGLSLLFPRQLAVVALSERAGALRLTACARRSGGSSVFLARVKETVADASQAAPTESEGQ